MPDFISLNLDRCKHVFGDDIPLLVSDDRSENSGKIEEVAKQYGAAYTCSRTRRHHFAGDLQSIINSLVFAKESGCDVAIKISLRLILLDPALKDMFIDRFQNHITNMIVPSKVRPNQLIRRESQTFVLLPLLTDIIALRVNAITPQELIDLYRHKCTTEKVPHASLIEALMLDLAHGKFKDSTHIEEAISVHQSGQPHRYLRKCQNHQQEYLDLARRLGIEGAFNTWEWNRILGVHYRPRPMAI